MGKLILDVVVPVYNEEEVLRKNILVLHKFLRENIPFSWRIVIADNASTDTTLQITKDLSNKYERISYLHLDEKGRGRALKAAWTKSLADILGYIDVDLAYDLKDLPILVHAVQKGASIATSNRYDSHSVVDRGWQRTILSQGYKKLARHLLKTNLQDFQSGFKFINKEIKERILPEVKDAGWFFDTELLVLTEKKGYSIIQLPVTCTQGRKTKVNILRDAYFFTKNLLRFRRRLKSEGLI